MDNKAWVLVADGSFDQVCETEKDAKREAKDLRAMGCKVRIIVCAWDEQDKVIDSIED